MLRRNLGNSTRLISVAAAAAQSPSASVPRRSFASTATPIDVGPLSNTNAAAATSSPHTPASAAAATAPSTASSGTTTPGIVPSTGSAAALANRAAPTESIAAAAARISVERRATDPYLPNAQKELPPYVARGTDAASAHYSAMTPEEALAFHAQQSPLGTHRAAAGDGGGGGPMMMMAGEMAADGGAIDASSESSSLMGGGMGLTAEHGHGHSLHRPLYERPGVRRDLIMQRREERRINYRQVQLDEAYEAARQDAEAEGGREARLVANRGGMGGDAGTRLLRDTRFAEAGAEGDADASSSAVAPRVNNAAMAPGLSTAAELREQAILNTMRYEDIDRLNRSTINDPAALSAPAEEQRFREMLSASGRFHMAEAGRVKRDVFGGDFVEGQYKYKTSLGVDLPAGPDETMPMFQIDPIARRRMVAERADAVLGLGPLAKLEQKKKARIAELEYEMSLLPEERPPFVHRAAVPCLPHRMREGPRRGL